MDNQNLLQFPVDKVRKKREEVTIQLSMNTITDRRRIGFVLSLMSVIMVAVYLNPQSKSFDVVRLDSSGRSIASVDSSITRDPAEEAKLVKRLSELGRGPASLGRRPSAEDRLRDEDLKSQYHFVYRDRFISEIILPEGNGLNYKPIDIRDRLELLKKYKDLFYSNVENVVPQLHEGSDQLREETYAFMKDDQVVGRARIKLDRNGSFYSLKVESSN